MQGQHLHRVDRELLDRARLAFKPAPVDPTTPLNKVMFDAGCMKVLDWLDNEVARSASKTTVQSVQDTTTLADSNEGLLRRLAGKV